MPTQSVRIATADGELKAALALPSQTDGPQPAVLVLHELFGLNDDIRRITQRFADHGYLALAPDLYSVGPRLRPLCIRSLMQALQTGAGRPFDHIEAARAWLAAHDHVDADRIAVAGFCLGGGFAILHAARSPLAAAADFYGAVPRDAEALDGICPVFAAYGQRDRVYSRQAQRLRDHLGALDVEHEVLDFPDAGHSFMSQYGPVRSLLVRLGPLQAGYHEESAETTWTAMLDFFARQLGGTN